MPSPRRAIRGRRQQWNDRHVCHLLTGHDWIGFGDEGWGHLSELPDDQLRATIDDMLACWKTNRHLVTSEHCGINPVAVPWFSDRLDVLINNAGIYPDEGVTIATVPRDRLVQTFQTNTFGPLGVTQAFLPYLRHAGNSRVINVSSGYGQLDGMSPDAPSYSLSKLALNGLTIMLADALRADGIAVNSMCPGWVRTDMGGPGATSSAEEGADTAVWLAEEAAHELTGKFFRARREIPW